MPRGRSSHRSRSAPPRRRFSILGIASSRPSCNRRMRDSMSLNERLSFPTNGLGATDQNDEMVEVRNRVHQVVIKTLGTAMLSYDVVESTLLQRLSLVVDQALEAEEVPLS